VQDVPHTAHQANQKPQTNQDSRPHKNNRARFQKEQLQKLDQQKTSELFDKRWNSIKEPHPSEKRQAKN
jgi:hypothetical protein